MAKDLFERIAEGRTDLVFDHVTSGNTADSADGNGVSLLQWCSYHGDIAAMKFLVANGAALQSLGEFYGLHTAAFHGHVRLCEYLIEQGADVDDSRPRTGETTLHAAIASTDRRTRDAIVRILLSNGADPNRATNPGVETDHFMRDCRTKAETPLHRAAAFGSEETVRLLLEAGARLDVKDMNGESPLSWASWHVRPRSIIRMLCYGSFRA